MPHPSVFLFSPSAIYPYTSLISVAVVEDSSPYNTPYPCSVSLLSNRVLKSLYSAIRTLSDNDKFHWVVALGITEEISAQRFNPFPLDNVKFGLLCGDQTCQDSGVIIIQGSL